MIKKLVRKIKFQWYLISLAHEKEKEKEAKRFQDFKNQELYGNEGSEKYFEELNR